MLSTRFANVLPKIKTIGRDVNERFGKIINESDKTPAYAIIGGIGAGCYAVTTTRNQDKVVYRLAEVSLYTMFGASVGFIAAPFILVASPLVVPVGLFAVYDNYKHKQTKQTNKQ